MALASRTTDSGFLLPSIHSAPPFFTQQPNASTLSTFTEHWIRLILTYARHKRLYYLKVEDAEASPNEWEEIFQNEMINRKLLPSYLEYIMQTMVSNNQAMYDPPTQSRAVILYWRLPEEWADVLHEWASSTGHLNTILTYYDITDPPVESQLSGIPIPLLRKAISGLIKAGRAQTIAVADGEGVRFFER